MGVHLHGRRLVTALAALVSAAPTLGCEKLVGIHASRAAGTDAAANADTGAGAPEATPGGSGDARRDGTLPADAVFGDGTIDSREVADGDAPPATTDGAVGGDGAPGGDGAAATDGGGGDGGGGDSAGTVDARTCNADPSVANPLIGTAFRFGSGPNNGGDPNAKGLCGFPNAQLPPGMYFGAIDSTLYAGAARCGTCMRVEAGSVKVEVQIIDVVQPLVGARGATITVDPAAQTLLSPAGGNPEVQVSFVPCSVTGNIKLGFTRNLDPSVVVMNHRNQLASVEMVTAATTVTMVRREYNSWTPPGMFVFGGGNVTFVLTDVFGNVLRLPNITISAGFTDIGQQFPACPFSASL